MSSDDKLPVRAAAGTEEGVPGALHHPFRQILTCRLGPVRHKLVIWGKKLLFFSPSVMTTVMIIDVVFFFLSLKDGEMRLALI